MERNIIEYIIAIGDRESEQPVSEEQDRKNLCACINYKDSFLLNQIIKGDFTYFDPTEAMTENVYRLAVYPKLESDEIKKMKEKFGDLIGIFKLNLQ